MRLQEHLCRLACCAMLLSAAFLVLALAPQAAAQQAAVSGADPTLEPQEGFRLNGFRSAHFGMDEAGVRAAIEADFGLSDDDVTVSENTVERTRVMSVRIPELFPDSGAAQVSYVLGYRSEALIQVGILWSDAIDPEMTPVRLVANGDVLRSHFLGAGYTPETVSVDVALQDGLLLFRGADRDGHTAILLLQGTYSEGVGGQTNLNPENLTVLYAQDPENPDILSLDEGSF